MKRFFAFDRDVDRHGTTPRTDVDGRVHFAAARISKADVNPYKGSEIPGWENLRLDPGGIYAMFRPPEELERAARTFRGLPLLSEHTAVNAVRHPAHLVVGSTGTDAVFEDPYLCCSVVVWSADAIGKIASGEQRQLSAGYRWTPLMRPGTWHGKAFDGRMIDLVGNHIALVEKGRAGPEVSLALDATVWRTRRATFADLAHAWL
jgi:uncharacterized protein